MAEPTLHAEVDIVGKEVTLQLKSTFTLDEKEAKDLEILKANPYAAGTVENQVWTEKVVDQLLSMKKDKDQNLHQFLTMWMMGAAQLLSQTKTSREAQRETEPLTHEPPASTKKKPRRRGKAQR